MTLLTERDVQSKQQARAPQPAPPTAARANTNTNASPVVKPKVASNSRDITSALRSDQPGARKSVVPLVARPVESGTWTARASPSKTNSDVSARATNHSRTGSAVSVRSNTSRNSDPPVTSRAKAEPAVARNRSTQPTAKASLNPFDEPQEKAGSNPFETEDYPSEYNPFD